MVSPSVNRSVGQPVSRSAGWSIDLSAGRSIGESVGRSGSVSVNRWVVGSVGRLGRVGRSLASSTDQTAFYLARLQGTCSTNKMVGHINLYLDPGDSFWFHTQKFRTTARICYCLNVTTGLCQFLALCGVSRVKNSAFTPRHPGLEEREHLTIMTNHLFLMNDVLAGPSSGPYRVKSQRTLSGIVGEGSSTNALINRGVPMPHKSAAATSRGKGWSGLGARAHAAYQGVGHGASVKNVVVGEVLKDLPAVRRIEKQPFKGMWRLVRVCHALLYVGTDVGAMAALTSTRMEDSIGYPALALWLLTGRELTYGCARTLSAMGVGPQSRS